MQLHINTPLIESRPLSLALQAEVYLKLDALQPSGSFKNRGIGYACRHYVQHGARALLASSGGNAGLAVAYSGRQLQVPVTVVVPVSTSARAIELIRAEQAEVIVHGQTWVDAHEHALGLAAERQAAYVHPFDDPLLWAGHSSVMDEVLAAGVSPDVVVLSVGGGGLLCGVVQGLQTHGLNQVPVLAVETQGAASLHAAVQAGQHLGIEQISSIATSLGARRIAEQAYRYLSDHPVHSVVVSDAQAVAACAWFLDTHRLLVEPACGASLAAVQHGHALLAPGKKILVIVCGGVGVSLQQLLAWQSSLGVNQGVGGGKYINI